MSSLLDKLARSHGIQTRYTNQLGEAVEISDHAKRELLKVLKVDLEGNSFGKFDETENPPSRSCPLPSAEAGRAWGVTCQLYSLRSSRNLGMGDFEDLARLAELCAGVGADFLGVNPLHALFLADPHRISPYSPSTRRFLNPLNIAIDQIEGGSAATAELKQEEPKLFASLEGDLVDYGAVGALKVRLLRKLFEASGDRLGEGFEQFCRENGEPLHAFALFEAISAHEVAAGGHSGWTKWPGDLQSCQSEAVSRFEAAHREEIRFHQWLQYSADRQLGQAQSRAKTAGMRTGLYLDFAVGVAPDGADTWAEPELTVREARVGSPPDLFNSEGQDWGLAPLSPQVLADRAFKPLLDAYGAVLKNAGAMRIDHAMGLARLWWIPSSDKPANGGFVRYPLGSMLDTVAAAASEAAALVIGEDLGTVPHGFSEAASKAGLLSYRVLYFEKDEEGEFRAPEDYPKLALACVSTHDLATLSGWWKGSDIVLRSQTGRQSDEATQRDLATRSEDRLALVNALANAGLLQDWSQEVGSRDTLAQELPLSLASAIHRYGARSASVLFAVQLDDMMLSDRQANLPGTTHEYPNWRIRSPVRLEELATSEGFMTLAQVMREERQR